MSKKTFSAGGVVMNPENEVLVVNQNNDSWSLPKGHIEAGEEALAAARREIDEEAGLRDLEFVKELGSYERHRIGLDGRDDPSEFKNIRLFLFRSKNRPLKPRDPSHPEARWVPKTGVAGILTHPKDREFFESILPLLPG